MPSPFTYDGSGSSRDRFRRLIGDTNPASPQFTDAEVQVYLDDFPVPDGTAPYRAAIEACQDLQAKYARDVNRTLGQASVSGGDRAKAYADLATRLRARSTQATGLVPMEVGGITRAEHRNVRENRGLVQPMFRRDMYDLPGTRDDTGDDRDR